jgi:acetyl esterase/lipase
VTFSGWMDMTASTTTYETRRWVGGAGTGMGDAFFRDDIGLSRLHAMCAADLYAGSLPIHHPLMSPVAAPPSLLAKLPPLMLMVGGAEQLLGGNLRFAQNAQAAGAKGVQLVSSQAMATV